MSYCRKFIALTAFLCSCNATLLAGELAEIRNYIEYSPTFASAGQPSREQLALLPDAGYERVIYIAMTSSGDAIADEDVIIKELGMEYIHLPVIWDAPTKTDFYTYAAAMQHAADKKTLLHCQANFRASAFSFLYRVLYEETSVADAKADMDTIWRPNEIWKDLIFAVLDDRGVSPHCKGCDWSVEE